MSAMDPNLPQPRQQEPGHHPGRWLTALALVLVAGLLWYAFRPSDDNPWDNQAIQAQFADLVIQRPQSEAQAPEADDQAPETDVHLVLHYVLTNHTGKSYRIPPPSDGVLMKNLSHLGLREVDSVVWDSPLIPAGKTGKVEFDVALHSSALDESPEDLVQHQQLDDFSQRELSGIQGLVFFDYSHRYAIDLPRGWN